MTEIMCRRGEPWKSGLIYKIEAEIEPVNGLFVVEQPTPCDGCPSRKGKVRISGGVEIKDQEDDLKVSLGLTDIDKVEKINIVTDCEQIEI